MRKHPQTYCYALLWVCLSLVIGCGTNDEPIVYYSHFKDVSNLNKAAPVFVRGLQVGQVSDIAIHPENPNYVIVSLEIEKGVGLPKDSKVVMRAEDPLDDNLLDIRFEKDCAGDCAAAGHIFENETLGVVASRIAPYTMMDELGLGDSELSGTGARVKERFAGKQSDYLSAQILRDADAVMKDLDALQEKTDQVMKDIMPRYKEVMGQMDGLSQTMKNPKTAQITQDFSTIRTNMETWDLDRPTQHAKTTMANAGKLQKRAGTLMEKAKTTMADANATFEDFGLTMEKIKSGEGSIGYMIGEGGLAEDMEQYLGGILELNENFENKKYLYVPFVCRKRFLRRQAKKARKHAQGKGD